jgi:hypothetical protein|tara:strand:+ start:1180 stop:1662 length:483 start_codon:yes stop_codon:yes gene_type:complete
MSPLLHIEHIDVYSPDGVGTINQWVSDIVKGIEPQREERIRFWVHIRDADRAFETLKNNDVSGNFQLSGRRAWNQEMILNEINILWTRYQNAVHGTHTIESLSDITSPAAFQIDANNLRPDLAPLHDALLSCGTDGWRPLIAIRVGLMECIASAIEESLE